MRHHGQTIPQCHIVFNQDGLRREDDSDSNDLRRNERVTKMLMDKYSLTIPKANSPLK
ncbi:hypothetical protein PARMER_00657 [Parabacteroides merdae ATCC 43184]|nr:hypothetical protein PARMER_00657 [Parabacteroides merdae ATCC 43184]